MITVNIDSPIGQLRGQLDELNGHDQAHAKRLSTAAETEDQKLVFPCLIETGSVKFAVIPWDNGSPAVVHGVVIANCTCHSDVVRGDLSERQRRTVNVAPDHRSRTRTCFDGIQLKFKI